MQEAMIICPQADNSGKSLQHVRHYAELSLCKAFGGVTTSSAKGSWVSPSGELVTEPVWQLVTACEDDANASRTIESVARYICQEGKQEAVYVRFPNGHVEILSAQKQQIAA